MMVASGLPMSGSSLVTDWGRSLPICTGGAAASKADAGGRTGSTAEAPVAKQVAQAVRSNRLRRRMSRSTGLTEPKFP